MNKKVLALSLLTMMTLTVSTGCSSNNNANNENSESEQISIAITGKDVVNMGHTIKLKARVENLSNPKLIWSSSDKEVATVDQDGVVLANNITKDSKVTISVKVKGHEQISASKEITVHYMAKSDIVYLTSLSKNSNFAYHEGISKLPDEDESKYKISNKKHLVGDDNFVDLKPSAIFKSYINGKLEEVAYDGKWYYDIFIYVKEGNEYKEIPANGSSLIETVDFSKCIIDFSKEAINHSFNVRIEPKDLTENQMNDPDYEDIYVVNYEFDVIDGYNVYNAKDLALFENRSLNYNLDRFENETKAIDAWDKYKKENNIPTNICPQTMILQSSIDLKVEDFPEFFFYKKDEVGLPGNEYIGSLKDDYNLYTRCTPNNKDFNFYGNYFTINAKNIPLIKADANLPTAEGSIIVPESELFRVQPQIFNGGTEINPTTGLDENKQKAPTANISDIRFLGNSSKNESNKDSGGILMFQTNEMNAKFDNVITRKWYQSFCIKNAEARNLTIVNSISKDNYTSFVYTHGAKEVLIKDSNLNSCGGPAIIATDYTHKNTTHEPVDINIVNSDIKSYINGSEGWFQGLGVSDYVAQLRELDLSLNQGNKSILFNSKSSQSDLTYMNLICLHMNEALDIKDIASGEIKPIQGSFSLNNELLFDIQNSKDENFKNLYDSTFGPLKGAPLIRSNASNGTNNTSYGYVTPEGLFEINNQPAKADSSIYKGDYVAIYFAGLMITLDYHEVNKVIE